MNIQFHGTSQQGKGIFIPPEPPPEPTLVIKRSGTVTWYDNIEVLWNYNTEGVCGDSPNIDVSSNYNWTLDPSNGGSHFYFSPAVGNAGEINTVTFTYVQEAPDPESDSFNFKINGDTYASVTHTAQASCP